MMMRNFETERRIAPLIGLFLVVALASGCSTVGYVARAGYGQGKILLGRVPIGDELARADLSPERRKKLELVLAAKRWAVEKIGLEGSRNYTTVFDTEGGPAVWNVSGCKDDAFEPHVWSFPIVGRVPYLGFFDEAEAKEAARELEAKDYDVVMYGADAYSTLGWFDDPLFTSMLRRDEVELATTVIHEMTHATIYVPGDAEFNETLATFVGTQGAIDWFRSIDGEGSPRARDAEASLHDDRVFAEAIGELRKRLEAIYAENIPREQKLAKKEKEIDDFPRRYREEVRPKLLSGSYDGLVARRRLNNAMILGLERYHGDLDLFVALHKKLGGALRATVLALARIAEADDPKKALLDAIR